MNKLRLILPSLLVLSLAACGGSNGETNKDISNPDPDTSNNGGDGTTNTRPVATDPGEQTALSGETLTFTVTGSDADGDNLTASEVSGPSHGTLALTTALGGGLVKYTPDAGYTGKDSFEFLVNDGTEDSAALTVNITVTAPANTVAYFPADNGSGWDLWSTDGSDVTNLDLAANGSYPQQITPVDDGVFFTADFIGGDGVDYCRELYYYDGTQAQLVENLNSGANDANPEILGIIDGGGTKKVVMTASDDGVGRKLYLADTTTITKIGDGVVPADIGRDYDNDANSIRAVVEDNGTLYFAVRDDALYKVEGNTVSELADSSNEGSKLRNTPGMAKLGEKFYYQCQISSSNDYDLCIYNSEDETLASVDLLPDDNSSPSKFTTTNDRVYFSARHDHGRGDVSRALYVDDGSGTPQAVESGEYRNPDKLVAAGDTLFFNAKVTANGPESTYAAANDTVTKIQTDDIPTLTMRTPLGRLNDELIFRDQFTSTSLWVTDGTEGGTQKLNFIDDVNGDGTFKLVPSNDFDFAFDQGEITVDGKVVFGVCRPVIGCEVWRSNGSSTGTDQISVNIDGAGSADGVTAVGSPDKPSDPANGGGNGSVGGPIKAGPVVAN